MRSSRSGAGLLALLLILFLSTILAIAQRQRTHGIGRQAIDTQLTFDDPTVGTLLMQVRGAAASDLPLRAVAWEEEGQVWLSLTDPVEIVRRYAITGQDRFALAMRLRLDRLALQAVTPY